MNEQLLVKLELVLSNLMNLERPENEAEYIEQGISSEKVGYFARDFGMDEWDWPQGVGLFCLQEYNKITRNSDYTNYIFNWVEMQKKQGLPQKNINTTAPLIALSSYEEFDDFCLEWVEWLLEELPKTEENGFQHVTSGQTKNDIKLNEGELWLDTLFMTLIFLTKVAVKNQDEKLRDTIEYQILLHIKYLFNHYDNLFYHGWSFQEKNNFSEVYWCRGNAWFTYAIPEILLIGKKLFNNSFIEYVKEIWLAQAKKLLLIKSSNGLWHTVLNDSSSYTETSGSAAIIAGMFKGIELGWITIDNYDLLFESLETVMERVDVNGRVNGVSAGTPIGETASSYKSIITAPMSYGQGLTALAIIEGLKHENKVAEILTM